MTGAGEEGSVDGIKDKCLLADSATRQGASSELNSSGVSSVSSVVSARDSERSKKMKKKKHAPCSKKSNNTDSKIKSEILKGKKCQQDKPRSPISNEMKNVVASRKTESEKKASMNSHSDNANNSDSSSSRIHVPQDKASSSNAQLSRPLTTMAKPIMTWPVQQHLYPTYSVHQTPSQHSMMYLTPTGMAPPYHIHQTVAGTIPQSIGYLSVPSVSAHVKEDMTGGGTGEQKEIKNNACQSDDNCAKTDSVPPGSKVEQDSTTNINSNDTSKQPSSDKGQQSFLNSGIQPQLYIQPKAALPYSYSYHAAPTQYMYTTYQSTASNVGPNTHFGPRLIVAPENTTLLPNQIENSVAYSALNKREREIKEIKVLPKEMLQGSSNSAYSGKHVTILPKTKNNLPKESTVDSEIPSTNSQPVSAQEQKNIEHETGIKKSQLEKDVSSISSEVKINNLSRQKKEDGGKASLTTNAKNLTKGKSNTTFGPSFSRNEPHLSSDLKKEDNQNIPRNTSGKSINLGKTSGSDFELPKEKAHKMKTSEPSSQPVDAPKTSALVSIPTESSTSNVFNASQNSSKAKDLFNCKKIQSPAISYNSLSKPSPSETSISSAMSIQVENDTKIKKRKNCYQLKENSQEDNDGTQSIEPHLKKKKRKNTQNQDENSNVGNKVSATNERTEEKSSATLSKFLQRSNVKSHNTSKVDDFAQNLLVKTSLNTKNELSIETEKEAFSGPHLMPQVKEKIRSDKQQHQLPSPNEFPAQARSNNENKIKNCKNSVEEKQSMSNFGKQIGFKEKPIHEASRTNGTSSVGLLYPKPIDKGFYTPMDVQELVLSATSIVAAEIRCGQWICNYNASGQTRTNFTNNERDCGMKTPREMHKKNLEDTFVQNPKPVPSRPSRNYSASDLVMDNPKKKNASPKRQGKLRLEEACKVSKRLIGNDDEGKIHPMIEKEDILNTKFDLTEGNTLNSSSFGILQSNPSKDLSTNLKVSVHGLDDKTLIYINNTTSSSVNIRPKEKLTAIPNDINHEKNPQRDERQAKDEVEASLLSAAAAIEKFAVDIIVPTFLSAGVGETNDSKMKEYLTSQDDRVFVATLLSLRELLTINAESIFFRHDSMKGDHGKEEMALRSQILSTALILAAVERLGPKSKAVSESFITALEKYDRGDEEFSSCLERADGRSLGIIPNGRILGDEENIAWRVSFNLALDRHPLTKRHIRRKLLQSKKMRQTLRFEYDEVQSSCFTRKHDKQRRLLIPCPNACSISVIEKVSLSSLRAQESRMKDIERLREETHIIHDYRRKMRKLKLRWRHVAKSAKIRPK